MKFKVRLTAVRNEEKRAKLVMTIAHIYKVDNNAANQKLANLPITLMRHAKEGQADKILKIFRSLGADVVIEEETTIDNIQNEKRNTLLRSLESRPQKVPGQSSRDAKMSFASITGIAIVGLVLLGAGTLLFQDKIKPLESKSQRFIREGRYEEAYNALQTQIKAGDGSAATYIQQAMALIMMARQEQDSTGWKDFGTFGYDQTPDWGADLLRTPKANRALQIIQMGAKQFPQEAEFDRWEGFILQTKGRYEEAEEAYNQAIRKSPENNVYRNLLGSLNKEQGLFDKADYQFRKILDQDPDNQNAIHNLTVLNLSHRKDTSLAMTYFRKTNGASDPFRYALRKELAQAAFVTFNHRAYPKDGQSRVPFSYYESKRQELQFLKKHRPDAGVALGDLYAQKGMVSAAIVEFNEARRRGVRTPELYANLAQAYIAQDKPASALFYLNEAVKENAINSEIYKNLALLERYYKEDKSKANKALKSYLQLGGDQHQERLYESIVDL